MLTNVANSSRAVVKPVLGGFPKASARSYGGYVRESSGPPRVRVSFAEKVVHGLVMVAGVGFIPTWISTNISVYNGSDAKSEE